MGAQGLTLERFYGFFNLMKFCHTFFVLLVVLLPSLGFTKGVYMSAEAFLAECFHQQTPVVASLWLNDAIRKAEKDILNHASSGMRIRYWHNAEGLAQGGSQQTVWMMDEIGKTRPISIGVSVIDGRIDRLRILEFRESRGAEVRMPFFTGQFVGLSLDAREGRKDVLSERIDGISGATLSVRAVKKVARFALYLHRYVVSQETLAQQAVAPQLVAAKPQVNGLSLVLP